VPKEKQKSEKNNNIIHYGDTCKNKNISQPTFAGNPEAKGSSQLHPTLMAEEQKKNKNNI